MSFISYDLRKYVSQAQKIAVGYNRTATGDNMCHKPNSTIDIFWIFSVSFGVSIDRYQIWWLGYKLEIPIPESSILKEGEVPNK